MSRPLYEIAGELDRVEYVLDLAEEAREVDGATEESFAKSQEDGLRQYLDTLKLETKEKITNICRLIRNWEGILCALDLEERRLRKRRQRYERKIEWLRNYLGYYLGEGTKFDSDLFNIGWTKGTSTDVTDIELIPAIYLRIKKEADRVRIKEDLLCGAVIPGARLKQTLTLKIK